METKKKSNDIFHSASANTKTWEELEGPTSEPRCIESGILHCIV